MEDALALVAKVRSLRHLPADLREMADLLERVATQDIEWDPDGKVRLKRGVAKDRVVSVVDPEVHHGHKTASQRADGYKAHVMAGGEGHRLVTAVEVTPANAPDDAKPEAMLDEQEQHGHRPEEVLTLLRPRRGPRGPDFPLSGMQLPALDFEKPPTAPMGRFSNAPFRAKPSSLQGRR